VIATSEEQLDQFEKLGLRLLRSQATQLLLLVY